MDRLPAHVELQRGEQVIALIRPDFQIQILGEALLGVLALIGVVLFMIGLDLAMERPLRGIGSGMMLTFALMVGPILAQRILSPRPVHVLTSHRLIVNEDTTIPLERITRLQIWLTGLLVQGVGQRVYLQHLIGPAAVARLIRDTIATVRRA